ISLRSVNTGYDMEQVLAIDLPMQTLGAVTDQDLAFYRKVTERITEMPGVEGVAMGAVTPWRDAGKLGTIPFGADGFTPENGEENPRARIRMVTPDFFNVMGVP